MTLISSCQGLRGLGIMHDNHYKRYLKNQTVKTILVWDSSSRRCQIDIRCPRFDSSRCQLLAIPVPFRREQIGGNFIQFCPLMRRIIPLDTSFHMASFSRVISPPIIYPSIAPPYRGYYKFPRHNFHSDSTIYITLIPDSISASSFLFLLDFPINSLLQLWYSVCI